MDFNGPSIFIGPREGTSAPAAWPAWSRTVDDTGAEDERALGEVHSYQEAEHLVRSASADRLFVPAEVLADMVREGAGP